MQHQFRNIQDMSGAKLIEALANLPANTTSLDMSWNDLGDRTGNELAEIFKSIPRNVTALNLSGNGLGDRSGAAISQALKEIPATVTSLDLSNNRLYYNKTDAAFSKILKAISTGVTMLDLRWNRLDGKNSSQMAKHFSALSPNVKTVVMSSKMSINLNDFWAQQQVKSEKVANWLCFLTQ